MPTITSIKGSFRFEKHHKGICTYSSDWTPNVILDSAKNIMTCGQVIVTRLDLGSNPTPALANQGGLLNPFTFNVARQGAPTTTIEMDDDGTSYTRTTTYTFQAVYSGSEYLNINECGLVGQVDSGSPLTLLTRAVTEGSVPLMQGEQLTCIYRITYKFNFGVYTNTIDVEQNDGTLKEFKTTTYFDRRFHGSFNSTLPIRALTTIPGSRSGDTSNNTNQVNGSYTLGLYQPPANWEFDIWSNTTGFTNINNLTISTNSYSQRIAYRLESGVHRAELAVTFPVSVLNQYKALSQTVRHSSRFVLTGNQDRSNSFYTIFNEGVNDDSLLWKDNHSFQFIQSFEVMY